MVMTQVSSGVMMVLRVMAVFVLPVLMFNQTLAVGKLQRYLINRI